MKISSLEYCAKAAVKRFLVDTEDVSKGSKKHIIYNQIKNDERFHAYYLETILSAFVEKQADLVTDELLILLLSGKFYLKKLVLRDCSNISLDGFASAISVQPKILHLDLSGCKSLSCPSIGQVLGEQLPNLESLLFESCENLNDETVKAIISQCIHLKFLSLSCNQLLTDEIFYFNSFPKSLKTGKRILSELIGIDLSGCQGITSTSIRNLFSLCGTTLQNINISWTKIDCTALVYLSGFSLSSAVYVAAHAADKSLPFSVDEMEATQELELQMLKDNFQGVGNGRGTQNVLDRPSFSPTEKKNFDQFTEKNVSFVRDLEKESPFDTEECKASDQIIKDSADSVLKDGEPIDTEAAQVPKAFTGKKENTMPVDESCGVKKDSYLKNMHYFFADSSKMNFTYTCRACDSKEKGGIKRTHSHSCALDFIQNERKGKLKINKKKNIQCERGCVFLSSQNLTTINDVFQHWLSSKPEIEDTNIKTKENGFSPETRSSFLSNRLDSCDEKFLKDDNLARCKDSISLAMFHGGKNNEEICKNDIEDQKVGHFVCDRRTKDIAAEDFMAPDAASKRCSNGGIKELNGEFVKPDTLNCVDYLQQLALLNGPCGKSHVDPEDQNAEQKEQEAPTHLMDMRGWNNEDSEIKALLTTPKEYYKPRQMLISQISVLDISPIVFYYPEVGIDCLKMFVTANHLLKSLKISWSSLTDSTLEMIAENEPDLVEVGLAECECLSNSGISALGEHCKKLKQLDLQGVPFISDRGLYKILSHGILEELSLAECAVTDLTLQYISKFCSDTMRILNLSWCENVTDAGVADLLQSCKYLESLNLRQCKASFRTMDALTLHGESLTYLGICSVQDLTNALAIPLVKSLRNLTFIDLSWNCMVTDETITSLLTSCSFLREAILAGLKLITSKPFLPMISGYREWRICREAIRNRLRKKMAVMRTRDASALEVLDEAFYLPYRSLHYAPILNKIDMSFCDKVDDIHLAEIVSVCRGTLAIEDYYTMKIQPRWDF